MGAHAQVAPELLSLMRGSGAKSGAKGAWLSPSGLAEPAAAATAVASARGAVSARERGAGQQAKGRVGMDTRDDGAAPAASATSAASQAAMSAAGQQLRTDGTTTPTHTRHSTHSTNAPVPSPEPAPAQQRPASAGRAGLSARLARAAEVNTSVSNMPWSPAGIARAFVTPKKDGATERQIAARVASAPRVRQPSLSQHNWAATGPVSASTEGLDEYLSRQRGLQHSASAAAAGCGGGSSGLLPQDLAAALPMLRLHVEAAAEAQHMAFLRDQQLRLEAVERGLGGGYSAERQAQQQHTGGGAAALQWASDMRQFQGEGEEESVRLVREPSALLKVTYAP